MCSRESKHARRKGLFSCHRQVVIIVAYVLIIAAIVALGVKWRSWDFERIRDMDYRKHSFLKMRHIQNDNVEIQGCVNEVRERMLSEKLYIMSEYPAGNNMWEIIGQSGKYWLWAVYFNKATIVLATARQKNAGEKPQLECLAFNGFIDTGSKAYLAIAFFLLAGTAMLFIRKEYLPHIFRDDSEGGNRRKPA